MSETNWIVEAKKHFEQNGNIIYTKGDEISKKSQEINEKLKDILVEKFRSENDMELNLQGSKWSLQGHQKLKDYIWYRSNCKELGRQYPVVFGIALGKAGLSFTINIYNDAIGIDDISEKLGTIIEEVIVDKKILESKDRDSENEKYKDFGYFGLETFDDDKFNQVLNVYKEVVYKINAKIFEKTLEQFNEFLKKPSDITHLSFGVHENSFYQNKKQIKDKFETFLKESTFKNLEWWDKSINSANMQGNQTNLIKKLQGLTLEEVKKLQDNSKLEKVQEIFEKIKNLVFDGDTLKNDLTYESVENGIKEIDGMNATARELAYYIQMDKDKIPLVNGMTTDVIDYIEKVTKQLDDIKLKPLQSKIDKIKQEIKLPENFKFQSYYVIDQFFNLLHKISKKDLTTQSSHKDLYEYAYLFSNLTGKADKKAVEKDDFIETLKKGKNIIYYGAPGTGKTFGVKSNILNIVENEEKQFVMTQFHPSYTYEDFIEGVKPARLINGVMSFELKDGEFKIFCERAKIDEDNFSKESNFSEAIKKYGYFFFVDEINRAELSRVFGELLYSLEYRGKSGKIKTQYSSLRDENEYFYIPENLFFMGTMNDVDRSIDSFDLALRRRFVWLRKDCDYKVIENEIEDIKILPYREACEKLNNYVINIDGLGEKYQIGHSYFLKIKNYTNKQITQNSMNELFTFHIEPLLTEYLRVEFDEKGIKQHLEESRKKFKLDK